jgi:hypothetical protein
MKPSASMLLFLCTSAVVAQDTTSFAIQFAYAPNRSISYFYEEIEPLVSNEFEFGGRVQPAAKLSIDLMAGARYVSGYDDDQSSQTTGRPSVYSVMIKTGVMYDLYKGDRSTLGALVFGGMNYEKTFTTNFNDNSLTSFKLISPFGFIGVEPSIELTKNFVFFTRLGLCIRYNPATKAYEAFENPSRPGTLKYELVDKENASTTAALEGFCIGIRYQFRSKYF